MKALIFSFMAASLLLSSCQKAPSKSSQLRIFKTNFIDDPKTFDPRKGSDPIASTVHFLLYEGLTRFLPDCSVEPALAMSWKISEDGKTYTFTLRHATWSDGASVTAMDFEDSWKKILSPDFFAPNAHLLYVIKNARAVKRGELPLSELGVRTLDATTLQVELEAPTPYFLGLTAFCVLFPAKYTLDETSPSWANSPLQQIVTSGPFLLKDYQPGKNICFVKNPDYWDANNFHLDGIEISFVRDCNTAMQMFEQKQLHLIGGFLSPLSQEQILLFKNKDEFYSRATASTNVVFFNTARGPLINTHIRRAIALAVDRQSIVDHIMHLGQPIALEVVPLSLKKEQRFFLNDRAISQAQEEFQRGLDQLGIDKSVFKTMTLVYFDSPQQKQIAQTLQNQWKQVLDIEISIKQVDWSSFLDLLNKRDFDLVQGYYAAQYPDPMNILERFQYKDSLKNYCNWENDNFSSLLNQSFTVDEKQRNYLLEEAEKILCDELPFSPLYHECSAFLLQKNLKNFHQTVIGTICYKDLMIDDE